MKVLGVLSNEEYNTIIDKLIRCMNLIYDLQTNKEVVKDIGKYNIYKVRKDSEEYEVKINKTNKTNITIHIIEEELSIGNNLNKVFCLNEFKVK